MKFHLEDRPVLRSGIFSLSFPCFRLSGLVAALAILTWFSSKASAAIYDFRPTNGGTVNASFGNGQVNLNISGSNQTNVPCASANDIRNHNGVVAWSSGGTVFSYVFDEVRGGWVGTTSSHAASGISDLSSADGVVAWSVQNGNAFYRVYDPAKRAWVTSNGQGPIVQSKILNTNGVVAWSTVLVSPLTRVCFRVYDPTRAAGWMERNVDIPTATSDLRTRDGIVAWSNADGFNATVRYEVYDPSRGEWRPGSASASSVTSLAINNSQVSWSAGGQQLRGYNPGNGLWEGTPVPLAYFAVSTNAGNAPFLVSFIDMSIGYSLGVNSWSWNFGDNLGSSTKRSPTYRYTTFGRFTAVQTVNGNTTFSRPIVTDITPPVGTNVINNGSPFTTNPIVTLKLSATDNSGVIADMHFSNTNNANWSNWEPFATNKTWTLSAGNGEKTVYAQFRDVSGNTSAVATATILLDTTPPPVVSFVSTNVLEANGSATVRVLLSHRLSQTVSVRVSTANGTATAPQDYTAKTELLIFPPNSTNLPFTVQIAPDGLVELHETVLLSIADATNALAGEPGTIVIRDDEIPTVSLVATNLSASEDSGSAVIQVALNAPSGNPVTVSFHATNGTATAESDYTPVQGELTFAPGETVLSFAIPLIDESVDEFSETVNFALFNPINANLGQSAGTLTILDDDNPAVSFSSTNYFFTETSGVVRVSVRLSKPFGELVEVDYEGTGGSATPGVDYDFPSGTLFFGAGQTNRDIFLTLRNDSEIETNETIQITITAVRGASAGPIMETVVTVLDEDGAPQLLLPRLNASGQFQTTFVGTPGHKFSLEVSTNLFDWEFFGRLTNTTGTLVFTDTNTVHRPQRFYRTQVP